APPAGVPRGRLVRAVPLDLPGRDAVDGDAARPELPRERLGPAHDTGSDRVAEGNVLDGLLRRDRSKDEDPAPFALHQVGKAELDEPDSRDEEQLDRLLDRLRTETDRSPGRWAAAIPDEDVDASEGLDRALDDGVEITRIGDGAA